MFYPVSISPSAHTPFAESCCPRCGLVLLVIPQGDDARPFNLALGEALEAIQAAQDAMLSAQGSLEEAVVS